LSIKHTADYAPLISAIADADVERVGDATRELLRRGATPGYIAGHIGVLAARGDTDGHALATLAAAERIASWASLAAVAQDPDNRDARHLAALLPLVQALYALAPAVARAQGMPELELPEPIFPAELPEGETIQGVMNDAVARADVARFAQALHGLYATGVDYRAMLSHIYVTLRLRYPADGHPYTCTLRGSQILDKAEWGDRAPDVFAWLCPLIITTQPNEPFVATVRAFVSAPEHDLSGLRTRLAPPNDALAGPALRRQVLEGDAGSVCQAVYQALMGGASPRAVAMAVALSAAQRLLRVPAEAHAGLLGDLHRLLTAYVAYNAATQIQDVGLLPLLFTVAAAVNAQRVDEPHSEEGNLAALAGTERRTAALVGGLIAPVLLRTIDQQVAAGEESAAVSTARRYIQLGHPAHLLAGAIGMAVAREDVMGNLERAHAVQAVEAACSLYLALSQSQQATDGLTLLQAAIRIAAALRGGHSVADALGCEIAVGR
jgi:hypothetical protein